MSGKTPGQAAQEVSVTILCERFGDVTKTWDQLTDGAHSAWEAIAAAGVAAYIEANGRDPVDLRSVVAEALAEKRIPELGAVACEAAETGALRAQLDEIHAERDGLTDRIAALITELNAARAERDRLRELLNEASIADGGPVPQLRHGTCPAHIGQMHVQVRSGSEWLCLRGLADLHEASSPQRPPELGAVAYEAAETGALRDLVAEILDHLDTAGITVDGELRTAWSERAGLEVSAND